jgi:hypothetical protein
LRLWQKRPDLPWQEGRQPVAAIYPLPRHTVLEDRHVGDNDDSSAPGVRRAPSPAESDPRQEAVMARLFGLVTSGIPEPRGQYHTVRSA